jgi:hypothetical protein
MLMMKNFNYSKNICNKYKTSYTPAELRINKDLMEMKNNRITTKLFHVKFSNVFKELMNDKYTMLVSMECIESKISYEVIKFLFVKT